jgi:N-acetylglucosaminyldiphosphoundecaprenol N-acetyl-beta-D-mannosaminyltransferase
MSIEKTAFYNIGLTIINTKECLEICSQFYNSERCHTVFFINAHCFNIAQKNSKYFKALNKADLVLNDGIGIDIAAKLNKNKLKENMNGTDLIPKIISHAYQAKQSFYLIGGVPGIIEQTKKELEKKHSHINIVGIRDGYFLDSENESLIAEINNSKAEVLIIGMGVPRQELWLIDNIEKLKFVRLAIAGGAIVDFIAGKVKRAPVWVQKLKIEWLYRFINEPKRLFKRYFIGNFVFFLHLFSYKLRLKNRFS